MALTRPNNPRRAALVALAALLATFATLAILCMNADRSDGGRRVRTDSGPLPVSVGVCVQLGTVEKGRLLDFSPDGNTLAVVADGGWTSAGPIRLWDIRSGTELGSVGDGWDKLETVRFSPDSTLIAAHDKRRGMGVWEVRTAKQRDAFKPPTIFENWVNYWFSPDSKALIVEHYGENFPNDSLFKIRDIGAGRDRAFIPAEPWLFAFSPDGSRVATGTTAPRGGRDRLMLWGWAEGKAPVLLRDHGVSVRGVAFSRDLTEYATVNVSEPNRDTTDIQIVNMDTGVARLAFTHTDEETHIQEIAFSRAGNLLIANGGGGTQLHWTTRSTVWDITGPAARKVGNYPAEPAVSPDGRLLAVRNEPPVKAGRRRKVEAAGHEPLVVLKEVATGRVRGGLTRADDATSSAFGTYNNHTEYPSVVFSPDGRVVAVWHLFDTSHGQAFGCIARVWQVEPLAELCTLESCQDLRFSPDGRALVVLAGDGSLKFWRVR